MTVLAGSPSQHTTEDPGLQGLTRIGPVVLALVVSIGIFVFGTPYFEIFESTNDDPYFNGALTIGVGILAWVLRHRNDAYAAVSSALFVTAAAMWSMVIGPFNWVITADPGTVEEAFQDKLAQFLAVVPVILVLAWLAGRSRESLYLERGNTARSLKIGVPAVIVAAVGMTLVALADGASFDTVLEIAPWLVGFAAMNAAMEELWFRSVSLRPYVEHLGLRVGVGVTALVFGLAHVEATYMSNATQIPFALLVAALGALLAWIMRWTNSILGAVLFHIALDFVVALEFIDMG